MQAGPRYRPTTRRRRTGCKLATGPPAPLQSRRRWRAESRSKPPMPTVTRHHQRRIHRHRRWPAEPGSYSDSVASTAFPVLARSLARGRRGGKPEGGNKGEARIASTLSSRLPTSPRPRPRPRPPPLPPPRNGYDPARDAPEGPSSGPWSGLRGSAVESLDSWAPDADTRVGQPVVDLWELFQHIPCAAAATT
jgi:hypothetical protein